MIGPARYWREIPQRYRYEAAKCTGCDKVHFPPRLVCSGCQGRKFEKTTLARTGSVETFTVIHVAPSGFSDEAPTDLLKAAPDDLFAPVRTEMKRRAQAPKARPAAKPDTQLDLF